VFHNIIEFYKKSDNTLIGYLMDDFSLTEEINRSKLFLLETNLDLIAETLLRKTYKRDWDPLNQSMSKHTYGHLYEDWFKDVDKKDAAYRIIHYENELRKLKMKKLKNKKGEI
jgi:hypothetical protein